jgi:hypothetical protein
MKSSLLPVIIISGSKMRAEKVKCKKGGRLYVLPYTC